MSALMYLEAWHISEVARAKFLLSSLFSTCTYQLLKKQSEPSLFCIHVIIRSCNAGLAFYWAHSTGSQMCRIDLIKCCDEVGPQLRARIPNSCNNEFVARIRLEPSCGFREARSPHQGGPIFWFNARLSSFPYDLVFGTLTWFNFTWRLDPCSCVAICCSWHS